MRIAVLFAFNLWLVCQVQGQVIRFGAQAGLNMVSLDARKIVNYPGQDLSYSHMESFNIGAHLGFIMSQGIGFSVEPGFIRKGTLVKYTSATQQIDEIQFYKQLFYLSIPVVAEYYPVPRFYVAAGIEPSFMINNSEIAKSETDIKFSGDSNVRKDDTSLILGMGFRINKAFEIMTRYGRGLRDLDGIFKDNVVSSAFDGKTRHYSQYFQLMFRVNVNALNDPSCNTGWRSN
jgi:hypothetical protein